MSLVRLIFYSAILGGWAAFLGWALCEFLFLQSGRLGEGYAAAAMTAALVGGAIGCALSLASGLSNGQIQQMAIRIVPGLAGGVIGGAIGGFVGNALYGALGGTGPSFLGYIGRALGWTVMGLFIGVVDGLYDRSLRKIRNGLLGGAIGGLLGGLLFDPIVRIVASPTGMSSRATAFVILGLCIGALIGVVQVVLREAWLTVVDGYRPGRQLILSSDRTVLGRAEHVAMPFLGSGSKDLEMEHAAIVRQPDGTFALEDLRTQLGTKVNNLPVQGRAPLRDNDIIRLASNIIRFNERTKDKQSVAPVAVATAVPVPMPVTPSHAAPSAPARPASVVPQASVSSRERPSATPVLSPPAPVAAPVSRPAPPVATPAPSPTRMAEPKSPVLPPPQAPRPQANPTPSGPAPAPVAARPPAPSGDRCPNPKCAKPVARGSKECFICGHTW